MELTWSLQDAWNSSLSSRTERELKPRDYIWASEIGGSFIDRYLKMKGEPPTNPPNARSLRKFEAGNLWEFLLEFVLKRAGLLINSQERIEHQYPGLLRVSGKLDFLAGGMPDWKRARAQVAEIGLPEALNRASLAIVDNLQGVYGNDELKTIVLECKSSSSFMMDRYESLKAANPNHRGQIFHYLKGKGFSEGHIVYICKDDCRMLEIGVFNPSTAEDEYRADIAAMTEFIVGDTEPPKEREILFDNFRFSTNWKVEYSGYLTMLYGYKEPMNYREAWDRTVAQMNRVYKRCVSGANMTTKNLLAITAAKNHFPSWDELVEQGKKAAQKNPAITKDDPDDSE